MWTGGGPTSSELVTDRFSCFGSRFKRRDIRRILTCFEPVIGRVHLLNSPIDRVGIRCFEEEVSGENACQKFIILRQEFIRCESRFSTICINQHGNLCQFFGFSKSHCFADLLGNETGIQQLFGGQTEFNKGNPNPFASIGLDGQSIQASLNFRRRKR